MSPDSGTDPAVQEPWWRRREIVLLALLGSGAAIFLLRWTLLREFPYPPSGDAGGDLYLAHAWLGHGLPQLNESLQTPPLYYFAIVAPFTTFLPTFEGIQAYMAFVPALLVGPAYLLVRESGAGRWASVFGAALLSGSTIWSLMVTWNAAFNLFGIFLLLFFLAAVIRALRSPSWTRGIGVGITFALVGAAHELTFLVAILVLGFVVVWSILCEGSGRLRRVALMILPAAIISAPLAYFFYGPSASAVSTGGGGGSYLSNVFWAFQNGPFFAWGYQGVSYDAVVVLDLVLSIAAMSYLGRQVKAEPFTVVLTGVLAAVVAVILLDPSNSVRGLYFLPIPFIAPVPALLERGLPKEWTRLRTGAAGPAPVRERTLERLRRSPNLPTLSRVLFTALAVGVLVVNANVSSEVMRSGIAFNESLHPDAVAAMDWIRTHTPANASFIDGAHLEPWMWGYAERMDYAAAPLGNEVTANSVGWALTADYVHLGSFLLSNPYWVVSSSYPSPEGAPQIFLATPGYWEPFLGSESTHDTIGIAHGNHTRWLGVQYAALLNASGSEGPSGLTEGFHLLWRDLGVHTNLTATLSGEDFALGWGSPESPVVQVNYSFGIPPSGYFFDYRSVPNVVNVSVLNDTFALAGVPFSVSLSGGRFTQTLLPDGWTQLWFWGNRSLNVSCHGMLPQNSLKPGYLNTSRLLDSLGVDHAIVDVNADFGMYERLRAGVFWSKPAHQIFQSGPVVVFGQ